jgi:hypothetical protein
LGLPSKLPRADADGMRIAVDSPVAAYK